MDLAIVTERHLSKGQIVFLDGAVTGHCWIIRAKKG